MITFVGQTLACLMYSAVSRMAYSRSDSLLALSLSDLRPPGYYDSNLLLHHLDFLPPLKMGPSPWWTGVLLSIPQRLTLPLSSLSERREALWIAKVGVPWPQALQSYSCQRSIRGHQTPSLPSNHRTGLRRVPLYRHFRIRDDLPRSSSFSSTEYLSTNWTRFQMIDLSVLCSCYFDW